jgi:hypothetical protein
VIFGHAYNYGHPRFEQQYENWFCPAVGEIMLLASLAILLLKGENSIAPAKSVF